MISISQKNVQEAYIGTLPILCIYVGNNLIWSSWEYPVKDEENILIKQAFDILSYDGGLYIDSQTWEDPEQEGTVLTFGQVYDSSFESNNLTIN